MKIFVTPALLGIIFLFSCRPVYTVQKTENSEYVLSDTSNSQIDSSINSFIVPYREKVSGTMNTVLAESEMALEKGTPESTLGDFVSDACLSEANKIYYPADGKPADFIFLNNGGLRKSLPKGNITLGDVFELMPFENQLVVLTINGKLVKKIFNFIASKDGAPVSGVRFQIKDHEAVNITINSEPLDTTKTYKAITSDYLANGGDSYDFLTDIKQESTNLKVRDAISQNLTQLSKQGKKLMVVTDGRISYAR